jgi:ribonuclease HI
MRNPSRGGWGALGRNHEGEAIFTACGSVPNASDALQTELMALINTIPVAEQLGLAKVTFSTDCSSLAQGMKSSDFDLSWMGPLFRQGKFALFGFPWFDCCV